MTKLFGGLLSLALVAGLCAPGRAADPKDTNAILDHAIQALGGADKLGKVKTVSWTGKGTVTLNGSDNPVTMHVTAQGLDHYRQDIDAEFGGNQIKAVTVVAGDKGWRQFGGMTMELDKDALANDRRMAYLSIIPITILPLKDSAYKLEGLGEEKVGDKPALGIRVTPPDGKEFRIWFDEESGLPVRLVAKVLDFQGNEYTQDTTLSDYQDQAGIKKATHVSSKHDGEKFIEQQISDFKVLDQADPKAFDQPQ